MSRAELKDWWEIRQKGFRGYLTDGRSAVGGALGGFGASLAYVLIVGVEGAAEVFLPALFVIGYLFAGGSRWERHERRYQRTLEALHHPPGWRPDYGEKYEPKRIPDGKKRGRTY